MRVPIRPSLQPIARKPIYFATQYVNVNRDMGKYLRPEHVKYSKRLIPENRRAFRNPRVDEGADRGSAENGAVAGWNRAKRG
jgi:hypothetical protein